MATPRPVPATALSALLTLMALLPLGSSATASGPPAASVGPGAGRALSPDDPGCGELFMNADSSYESGYTWQFGGIQAPDYGAFAERYTGDLAICSVVTDLTQVGYQAGQVLDLYIWEDGAGEPGAVHAVRRGANPGAVAFWPSVSRHVFAISGHPGDAWWVGYWGAWPGGTGAWFVGADLDGTGGTPRTKIAPGLGYPSGWQNVSLVWGPTQALGLGAEGTVDEVGACCFLDGTCALVAAPACDGDYLGDGTRCAPNPCPQLPDGACCLPDGSCRVRNAVECDAEGGDHAEGVPCEPNPCPQPPDGACCLPDGSCLVRNVWTCEAVEGSFLEGVLCTPNPCPQPPSLACCFPDGSCQVRDAFTCDDAGGTPGDASTCEPNPCPPPPVGACCSSSGICRLDDVFDCEGAGGNFLGEGTSCTPDPCTLGACCFPDGNCTLANDTACTSSGGTYDGGGTTCDPNPCPQPILGACCLPDGDCEDLLATECALVGGTFQGAESICATTYCLVPCPPPAPRAALVETTRRGDAGPNADGVLLLHRNPALEFTTVEAYCGLADLHDCAEANTRVDVSIPVVFHVLAAFPETAEPRLAGVTFGIEYPDCVIVLAIGRCATFELEDANWPSPGSGTALTFTPVREERLTTIYWFAAYVAEEQQAWFDIVPHHNQGGWFADDSIPSKLDAIADYGRLGFFQPGYLPCPNGEGACCFPDGLCLFTTAEDCQSQGGVFGMGASCDPNPCQPVPTIESSWGKVKARFR